MDKVEKIKREHVGRWIGVKDDELVAVSESHRGLYKRLKEKGISGVYVFYSPQRKMKRDTVFSSGRARQMKIEENRLVVKAQLWGKGFNI